MRLLFVALSVTLSLQSLCFFGSTFWSLFSFFRFVDSGLGLFLCHFRPVVCFRQGDVFHMEVDYAGLALQLSGDSLLLWLQNTSRKLCRDKLITIVTFKWVVFPLIAEEDPSCSVPSPSSLDEPAMPPQCQRLSPSAHTRIILRHVFSA
ncbi:hypothetical protein POTOM_043068 [Populus tomentosa]|uniref:Uncharacterized protein n=1 Tax=Populus tomentosa TaxID=118781 RepID=A0A8X8CH11_POPTO|nr:hypothetical protein POTOM_043068 [Populus tomentosa]